MLTQHMAPLIMITNNTFTIGNLSNTYRTVASKSTSQLVANPSIFGKPESREFSKFLISPDLFIQTVKGQNNFW